MDIRNPFIMAPIKLGYAKDGVVNDRHLDFYSRRAISLGAIIPEPMYIDKGLREIPTQLGIDDDSKIDGLKRLVGTIHSGGAKAIAHLNHPGRMANPKIPGNYFVSSTDKQCVNGGAIPKRMNREDMEKAIDLFKTAATRAKEAGFDMIELQCGHGYLLAQFLSPMVNDRKDEYGGSLENRARFPIEVVKAVYSVGLPIMVRISGDEMVEGGIKIDEMTKFIDMIRDYIEMVHVSAGTVCQTPPWYFQHMFIPKGKTWEFAKDIHKATGIDVVFVGQINRFEDIKLLKDSYNAKYIALGRALLADPDFVAKYIGEIKDPYRPCLACSDGCLGGVKSGRGLGCAMNPLVGEDGYKLTKASEKKKYAVIGGGLAGMESAITLAMRGHDVVLYEKEQLGGQFNLASLPPKKENLSAIIKYYKNALDFYGVKVIFKEANSSDVIGKYDGVILATGSKPAIPPIEGLESYFWAEVLKDENMVENSKVLIIGGGLIGVEVAHKLLQRKNEVIIVEMESEIARGMEMIEKALTLKSFRESDIKIYLDTRVTKIDGSNVYIEGKENGVIHGVNYIIVATGMKSYNPLEKELSGKIPVYVVGDALKVGKAEDAIKSAFDTTKNL